MTTTQLITPYGGGLIDLTLPPESFAEARARATALPSVKLSARAACDLELLATGAFSPLDRFMGETDYRRVVAEMRLGDGRLFPVPVTLPISADADVRLDQEIALRDARNDIIALMHVEEIYSWDAGELAQQVLGTRDPRHPLVAEMNSWGALNVSGPLLVLQLPTHYDFRELRLTPLQARARLASLGRANVVAFQTRNPLHRAHEEMTKRAMEQTDGTLLLQPVVGLTKPGDVDHFTRVRSYKSLMSEHYERGRALLALLPLAMRMAGPREALWHAVIRRNYGANHLIVGRDHASPGLDSEGKPFYEPDAAQKLVSEFAAETGVRALAFDEMVYLPDEDRYEEASRVARAARTLSLSGTQVREQYLNRGERLPAWFTRPAVAEILAENYPPRHRQGVCVWFTGLSGAGKTTVAEILTELLLERGRKVTLLDGDVVRTHLSQGLGFSKADRDTNVRRIGFVAAEIARHGGIAVCAAVSPYRATRNEVRNMLPVGHFLEVFVDTPLEVCEGRDTKGLYARARRGEVEHFTGVSDVYERPQHAEIVLETVGASAQENALVVLERLADEGFVRSLE